MHDLAVTRAAVVEVLRFAKGEAAARVTYALITHPGHHAGPSSYGGFCFVNSAAVAAKMLRQTFGRVAVIDVDHHHGNGTMAVFWEDPTVFFASIHGDPAREYPFSSGFACQVGGTRAPGATLNVPMAGGTDWQSYKVALAGVIAAVEAFNPGALVISLGLDDMLDDPVALPLARNRLLPRDFAPMGNILLRGSLCHLPMVVVQEGGYMLDRVPAGVAAFLTGNVPADE
jgi:acetoin utilization deacetylase AcuC-like enzyme